MWMMIVVGTEEKKILSPMCTLQCNFLSLYFPFLLLKDHLYDHLDTLESGINAGVRLFIF